MLGILNWADITLKVCYEICSLAAWILILFLRSGTSHLTIWRIMQWWWWSLSVSWRSTIHRSTLIIRWTVSAALRTLSTSAPPISLWLCPIPVHSNRVMIFMGRILTMNQVVQAMLTLRTLRMIAIPSLCQESHIHGIRGSKWILSCMLTSLFISYKLQTSERHSFRVSLKMEMNSHGSIGKTMKEIMFLVNSHNSSSWRMSRHDGILFF